MVVSRNAMPNVYASTAPVTPRTVRAMGSDSSSAGCMRRVAPWYTEAPAPRMKVETPLTWGGRGGN